MTRVARTVILIVALSCAPHVARAQLGEVHLGALASYGVPNSYGPGGGIVIGVAAGRLTYVGMRWAYHAGSEELVGTPTTSVEVKTRVQVFALDLGVLFPAGAFEIVPGLSLGAARFAQRSNEPGNVGPSTAVWEHDAEFLVAPGLSIQTRLAGFILIPELQYFLGDDPELTWPIRHRGPVASMRIVVGREVGRIRH